MFPTRQSAGDSCDGADEAAGAGRAAVGYRKRVDQLWSAPRASGRLVERVASKHGAVARFTVSRATLLDERAIGVRRTAFAVDGVTSSILIGTLHTSMVPPECYDAIKI